jgi:hypothetical protein
LVDYVVYASTSQACKHVSRVSFSASYSKTVCSHKVPLNTRSHLDIAHHSDAYLYLGSLRNQAKVKFKYLNTELPYHNVKIRASPSVKQQPKGDLCNRLSKVPWYRYVSSFGYCCKGNLNRTKLCRTFHIRMQVHASIRISSLADSNARKSEIACEVEGRRKAFSRSARGI